MAQIDKPPRGLYSMLGLRDMGAVPQDLSAQVVATVDMSQFLLLDRELVSSIGLVSVNALTSAALITVPARELWYVHNFCAFTDTLAAGETIKVTPGFFQDGFYVAAGRPDNATAGSRAETYIEENFFLPPGGQLAIRVNQITTAGAIGVNGTGIITRLRI